MSAHSCEGPDSAGREWTGRVLAETRFGSDTGEADPALLRALGDPRDETALVRAVAGARLLVPVVAEARAVEDSREVSVVSGTARNQREGASDMAMVTLTRPDGQRALPVFSGIPALSAWDPSARPVPVTAARAAQAAVAERCDVLVLDLGTEASVVLRPSMVWALAQQREWLPSYLDPFVIGAVQRAVADEPEVAGCATSVGEPAGAGVLRVVLGLHPGSSSEQVEALVTRVGERLASDGETRARIDAVAFAVRPG